MKRSFLFLLVIILYSCSHTPVLTEPEPVQAEELKAPRAEIQAQREPDYITIIAAGDNLYHDVMIRSGEDGDYESVYSELRELTEKADIAFINQETLLAGGEFGFSGYPRFNTPQALGRAIAESGFNAVNHATNHVMDKGEKAILATLNFWDTESDITVLGIHRSEEERKIPKLITKNNITLGFLSYTYGTNGLAVPKDKSYLVSLIDDEIMAEEINALRPLCDVLIVSMHWGDEYQHNPNSSQKDMAAFLAEHRVDLVIGHHPHVIQPFETIDRPDGKIMFCFYSLGNLISAQTRNPTLLGALAYVKIGKSHTGETSAVFFKEAGAIPVVTHFEKGYTEFKVYPLYSYTEELAEKHYKNQTQKEITVGYFGDLALKIIGDKELRQNPFNTNE